MEFFKTYKTGGSFTTMKFSDAEFLNYNITMWLLGLAFSIILSVFISPILMVLRIVSNDEDDSWVFSFIGILASIYTLIDIHNGWLYSVILRSFNIIDTANLSALTLAYLFGHILLLIAPSRNVLPSLIKVLILVGSLFFIFKANEWGPKAPIKTTKIETQV